jgi:hypothetical protein
MTDVHRLRVGIDFDQAERDIKDFGAESAKQAAKLAQNTQNAVRQALAQANAGGDPASNEAAGAALRQIRTEIRVIEKELKEAFRAAGQSFKLDPGIFRDIDNIAKRIGDRGLSVGGRALLPDQKSGLLLPSIRTGYLGEKEKESLNRSIAGTFTGKDPALAEKSLNQIQGDALLAAKERRDAVKQAAANEREYAKDIDALAKIIGEEVALKRRRLAAERAAGADATRPFIRDIARDTASADFVDAQIKARTQRELADLEANDPNAGLLRSDRAATLAQEKINALEQSVLNEQQLAARSAEMARLSAEERALKERRISAEKRAAAAFFAGDTPDANAIRTNQAVTAADEARNKAALDRETQAILGTAFQMEKGEDLAAQKVRALQRELVATKVALGEQVKVADLSEDQVALQAQVNAATAQLRNQIKDSTNEQLRARGLIVPGGAETPAGRAGVPTLFQRGYSALHSRATGIDSDAIAAPRLGQFLGQKALSTAGFALTGGILYGAVSQMREIITEASELQIQLGLVRGMFDQVYGSTEQATEGFQRFRDTTLETARATATSASVVADLGRQLAGSFADENGVPDFERGAAEAAVAVQLARITKLPEQEINDSLTAVALAFEQTFTEISDAIVGLSTQYGVSATEIVQFTADLAPVGKALGFTADQLSAVGAAAQQRTGQSGASLAEQFRRILPTIQDARSEVTGLVADFDKSGKSADAVAAAFANNEIDQVLRGIVQTYVELDDASKGAFANQIATLVGGRREAGALFALLDGGQGALRAFDVESGQFGGALEDRMATIRKTVGFAFDELERSVEEFGIKLFEAGLADALVGIARAAALLVDLVSDLVSVFSGFNDALGGIPIQILAIVSAMKAFQVAYRAIIALRATETAVSVLGAPGKGINPLAAGGLLSAYAAPTEPGVPPVLKGSIAKAPILSRIAGSGATGALAAGAINFAAPLGAGLIALKAVNERAKAQGELDSQEADLAAQIEAELAKGTSAAEIRSRALSAGGGKISPDAGFADKVALSIGRFLTNEKDPIEVVDEVLGNAEAEANEQKLKVLDDALEKRQDEVRTPGGRRSEGGRAALAIAEKRDEVAKILDQIAEDPTDYDYARTLELLEEALNDPTLDESFANIDQEFARRRKALEEGAKSVERQQSGESQLDMATAISIYEAGGSSLQPVLDAIDKDIEDFERTVKAGEAAGQRDYAAELALLEAQNERGRLVADSINAEAELARSFAALSGQDTPEGNVALASDLLTDLQAGDGVPQEAIFQASMALAEAEQQAFLDRVNNTEDLAERLRLIDEGFEFSEQAQRGLLAIQLSGDTKAAELQSAADALHMSVQELSQSVIDVIIAYGGTAGSIVRTMLEARARELRAAANAPAVARNRMAREELNELARQAERALAEYPKEMALDTVTTTPGGAGGDAGRQTQAALDAERKAEAERAAREAEQRAEEARREAQAKANAILDVQAAVANGDALELAKIARRRAVLAGQYAKTESEKIAAFAQLIEADNQIRAAIRARNEAIRDMRVALSNDDPVKAANAAVADAMAALKAAKGAQQGAEAYAALIRASKAQKDAILALADAQTDILIAQANATGDTVKAAQLALQKIQRQLKRTDLNSTERAGLEAERIAAEAGVRDARLSEERATIDYQLAIGDITKQQAISALQSLLTIPKLTEEQIREINLAIKDLKSQLGADFQFNLPTQLGLPTVYEVRRLGQSGGTGGGYQDNRQINVTVNAETNATPESIASAVANVVGDPSRVGTTSKRF